MDMVFLAKMRQSNKYGSARNVEIITSNHIVLLWPTYTEPSPKRVSDKINMQKQGRNTKKRASCIVQPGLAYASQHLERFGT